MNRKTKRISICFICLLICLSNLSLSAFASLEEVRVYVSEKTEDKFWEKVEKQDPKFLNEKVLWVLKNKDISFKDHTIHNYIYEVTEDTFFQDPPDIFSAKIYLWLKNAQTVLFPFQSLRISMHRYNA